MLFKKYSSISYQSKAISAEVTAEREGFATSYRASSQGNLFFVDYHRQILHSRYFRYRKIPINIAKISRKHPLSIYIALIGEYQRL